MLLSLLPVLIALSFVSAFFAPGAAGSWLYNLAFSVVPVVCRAGTELWRCSGASGLSAHWSWGVWIIVALPFGWLTRRMPWTTRGALAIAVIGSIIALMLTLIPLVGYQHYIDAI